MAAGDLNHPDKITGGNMEQAKKLWALALAHKKISIAVAVVVVLIIIAQ